MIQVEFIGSTQGNYFLIIYAMSLDKAGCEWQTAECMVGRFASGKRLA